MMTRTRVGSTLERAAVGGLSLAYHDAGAGLPCVLVHGFPLDHRQWRAQLELAGDDTRLIVPDLRGHGASDAPPPPYPMTDFADDIRALVDRLGLDRVVLGGLSMGGYVALAFAGRYPERLQGLVLMATRAGADTGAGRQDRMELAARARAGGAGDVVDTMHDRIAGGREMPATLSAAVRDMILGTSVEGLVGSLEGMAARPDSIPMLPRVACPTLVIAGSEDALAPPSCARAMADAIPDADYLEVPGAGHLVPLERPEAVNPVLRRFLDRCRR